jgi:trehalose-6-phosphate synthase
MKVLFMCAHRPEVSEETVVELIIRDHATRLNLEKRKKVEKIVRKINKKFGETICEDIAIAEINDQ